MGVPLASIDEFLARLEALLEPMVPAGDPLRHFHATYIRTTRAFREELRRGGFLDNEWTVAWDLAFAQLYLDPLERFQRGELVPEPWRIAFSASRGEPLPALRHVLLGMNAHVNFDLPRALLAVITDEEFEDPAVRARREADHRHADGVLVTRVAGEDRELSSVTDPGDRSLLDRVLAPLNRIATRRFLVESRRKVWRNAILLSRARRRGREALEARTRELEVLSAARVADLRAPGQVLLKLAVRGFGVVLPDAAEGRTAR